MPPIAQKAASSPLNFGRIAKPLRGGGGAANSTSIPPSISGGSNSSSPLGRLQNEESGSGAKRASWFYSAGKPTRDVIRERLQHMATLENFNSTTDVKYTKWADQRLDRWLVDWCLRYGKEKTARRIAREKDIEVLVDLDLFSDIRRRNL
ncbi:hypothetical protein DFH05DRAFT_1597578 [Lentinula detonsa]|uniref:Uncharacterized protein n=1 Tax=Lentinula detonsa TaxID=2804962 RepID=A0A9W8TSV9_9AGAR|nr:hypothetical protein DFH05DRAFT_1597578 [Lentinula detonsa]